MDKFRVLKPITIKLVKITVKNNSKDNYTIPSLNSFANKSYLQAETLLISPVCSLKSLQFEFSQSIN